LVEILLDIKVKVDKIETPKAAEMKILYFSLKEKKIEIKLNTPERLIAFDTTKDVHFKIARKSEKLSDENAKFFGHGTVESVEKQEDQSTLIILIGGIPLKIILPTNLNEFKLNDEVDIAIF